MNFYDIVKDSIDIDKETGCWNWTKSTREGYGQIMIDGFPWTTHRLSYTMSKGEIPKNFVVRHSCHNTRCCNPEHLSIGTDRDNYHDSKNAHRDGDMKQSENWVIGGWIYDSIRDAALFTGLPFATIVKYSVNGVFNLEEYRKGCQKGNVKPKL